MEKEIDRCGREMSRLFRIMEVKEDEYYRFYKPYPWWRETVERRTELNELLDELNDWRRQEYELKEEREHELQLQAKVEVEFRAEMERLNQQLRAWEQKRAVEEEERQKEAVKAEMQQEEAAKASAARGAKEFNERWESDQTLYAIRNLFVAMPYNNGYERFVGGIDNLFQDQEAVASELVLCKAQILGSTCVDDDARNLFDEMPKMKMLSKIECAWMGHYQVTIYINKGHGSGANSWLIQLEGGGWCDTIRNCVYRKKTRRGSSIYMEKQIPFIGILSNKAGENPDFYNWNRVKVRYCDGASFGGDSQNEAAQLYFRGQRIWSAAMEELMSRGMRYAKQALLSGCSAGGLASILHCDEFRDFFPQTTKVKCLSDAGLFLDTLDVSGQRALRKLFGGVVSLQGVQKNLPRSCTTRLPPTLCFFPQNLIASVKTPVFLLNTAYDTWQIQESIAPPSADPHGYWHDCKLNNAHCSGSQIQFLQGFRNQMLNAVNPFSRFSKNGLFLNSCFAHCQSERQDTWFSQASPHIGNKGIAQSVGNWYFDRASIMAIDCPYPCDSSCHNLVFRRG